MHSIYMEICQDLNAVSRFAQLQVHCTLTSRFALFEFIQFYAATQEGQLSWQTLWRETSSKQAVEVRKKIT